MKEINPHYLIIIDRVNNLDTIELQVEVDEDFFQDKISQLQSIKNRLANNLLTRRVWDSRLPLWNQNHRSHRGKSKGLLIKENTRTLPYVFKSYAVNFGKIVDRIFYRLDYFAITGSKTEYQLSGVFSFKNVR